MDPNTRAPGDSLPQPPGGLEAGKAMLRDELAEAAFGLQIERRPSGQPELPSRSIASNQSDDTIYSSLSSGKQGPGIPGGKDPEPAGSGSKFQDQSGTGGSLGHGASRRAGGAGAGEPFERLASTFPATGPGTSGPDTSGMEMPERRGEIPNGVDGAGGELRPAGASRAWNVSLDAPRTQNPLPGTPSLPAGRESLDGPGESAGLFVRAASTAGSGPEVQRIQVLMQDDRLGRIALRMVDRAGLIHAVVRTEGAQGAQMLSESLPALLDSLSQRGLLASWTSAQGEGQGQHADPRHGQPRRQRDGSGLQAGGRRQARSAPVFQLEPS